MERELINTRMARNTRVNSKTASLMNTDIIYRRMGPGMKAGLQKESSMGKEP